MAVADTRTVSIQLSQLAEHLTCTLCQGMLRDAQTIPECLHSFCKSCIYRYFLVQCDPNAPKACPKCNMSLKARPIMTLISDQKVQDVVDKVFPEYKKRDRELEAEFYERHNFKRKKVVEPSSSDDDVADRTTSAAVKAVWNGQQQQQPASIDSSPSSSVVASSKTTSPSAASDASSNTVTVQSAHETAARNGSSTDKTGAKRPLKFAQMPLSNWSMTIVKPFTIEVYPEQENDDLHGLPELPLPFLHVDGRFKMFELRKYITRKLNLEKLAEDLEITCLGATVGPELSVHFIYRTIWQHRHARRPLMLHYRHLTP